MSSLVRKVCVVAVMLLVAPMFAWSSENAAPPVVFPPRPPEAELRPQNEDERDASIVVLDYQVEFSSRVPTLALKSSARRTKRHRARYLIKDHSGVGA